MNRRTFCSRLVVSSTALTLGLVPAAGADEVEPGRRQHGRATTPSGGILRPPDIVTVFLEKDRQVPLTQTTAGVWQADGFEVRTGVASGRIAVSLFAPKSAVVRLRLRWHVSLGHVKLFLGDHWERSYADLEWRGEVPNRPMPWYFLAHSGERTDGYGVLTGARGFCFWNADRAGISLWADVRSGGVGVQLGERVLPVCEVSFRQGAPGESPFIAAREFCRTMCARPRMPATPVFGTNDWYYHYGDSHPDRLLETTRLVVSVSPDGPNRPWSVIDDGWSPGGDESGMWDRGNERFGDMAAFSQKIADTGARPGIWFRPLLAAAKRPDSLRLGRNRRCLDPSLPDVLAIVDRDTRRLREWGYGLIKHDYSSFDILGRWGFSMGATLTDDSWRFADSSRTTAEIVTGLPGATRRGGRRHRDRLQHVQPPVCRPVRDQPHRRRHQRPVVGPDAPDGREHARVQGGAPRRLLRGRSRHRGDHQAASLGEGSAVAAAARGERHADVRVARDRSGDA
jgi:alpha-galactosidase